MFVWVLEGKVSDPREVGRELAQWAGTFGATAGYLGATGGVTDDRRFVLLVRWESEEAGNALLLGPEHRGWWDTFQQSFVGEVDFFETDDVTTHLAGGSDAAGLVQVMKVAGVDRARVEEIDREFDRVAAQYRPDVIGAIRAWAAPDAFVEATYFTSEAEARAGETQPPPPDLAPRYEDFLEITTGAEYFDLTEPYLHSAPAG